MKSGKPVVNPFGFTIVEVMIVLAITLVIFAIAVGAVSGRTETTEFMQEVNELQSNFQGLMNDVSTGTYNTQGIYCDINGGGPGATLQFSTSPGANTGIGDCMFLGEALLFTKNNSFYGYDVFGARQAISGSGDLSSNYVDAQPTVPSNIPNSISEVSLNNELVGEWASYSTTAGVMPQSTSNNIDTIAFLDDPSAVGAASPSNDTSGSISVNVIPVGKAPALQDLTSSQALGQVTTEVNVSPLNTLNSLAATADGLKNPVGGVAICFKSQSTDQSVLYTFGGNNRSTTIENQIFNGATCQ